MDDLDPQLVRFGRLVAAQRALKGWSQEDLADAAGIHRTYVSQVERGTKNLSLLKLLQIAKGLSVDPAVLVTELDA